MGDEVDREDFVVGNRVVDKDVDRAVDIELADVETDVEADAEADAEADIELAEQEEFGRIVLIEIAVLD